jgi:hypothetical protein
MGFMIYILTSFNENWMLNAPNMVTISLLASLALGSILDSLWEIYAKRKHWCRQYLHAASKIGLGIELFSLLGEQKAKWNSDGAP